MTTRWIALHLRGRLWGETHMSKWSVSTWHHVYIFKYGYIREGNHMVQYSIEMYGVDAVILCTWTPHYHDYIWIYTYASLQCLGHSVASAPVRRQRHGFSQRWRQAAHAALVKLHMKKRRTIWAAHVEKGQQVSHKWYKCSWTVHLSIAMAWRL